MTQKRNTLWKFEVKNSVKTISLDYFLSIAQPWFVIFEEEEGQEPLKTRAVQERFNFN